MAKTFARKKKSITAEELIDSLLDETNSDSIDLHTPSPNEKSNSTDDSEAKASETADLDEKSLRLQLDTQSLKAEAAESKPEAKSEKPIASADSRLFEKSFKFELEEKSNPEAKAAAMSTDHAKDDGDEVSEPTLRLVHSLGEESSEDAKTKAVKATPNKLVNQSTATEIRPSHQVRGFSPAGALSSAEASLKQSESLRIAQARITDLEHEVERLRRENEKLAAAGETMRRRADELFSQSENLQSQLREQTENLGEEKKIYRGQLTAKERDLQETKQKLEELETRLENNFKKIRVRERDLEHRLEIVKMESMTLVSTKDKMILELKRQIDQLTHEADHSKGRSQELYNQYKEKQETSRRAVRALRIALSILEGEDESSVPLKKAE
jgi:DNA repair exonuclease SbcCD ATPase subunit